MFLHSSLFSPPHFNNSWILGLVWVCLAGGERQKTGSSCQQGEQMTRLRRKKSPKKKADDPYWIPKSCWGIRSPEMSLIWEESSILILHTIRQQRSERGFISSASHRGGFLISSSLSCVTTLHSWSLLHGFSLLAILSGWTFNLAWLNLFELLLLLQQNAELCILRSKSHGRSAAFLIVRKSWQYCKSEFYLFVHWKLGLVLYSPVSFPFPDLPLSMGSRVRTGH